MAFRGILPEAPSFSTQLARGLGAGIGQGASSAMDTFSKLLLKKASVDPYKSAQQSRLASDSIFKQYSSRIKELQAIASNSFTPKEEREAAQQSIKELREERDSLFASSETKKRSPKKSKKVKFDVSNPEHKAKRDQVLKDSKNDRKKAAEILSKEFDL